MGRHRGRPTAAAGRDRRPLCRPLRPGPGRLRLDRAGRPDRPQGVLPGGPSASVPGAADRPGRGGVPRPEGGPVVGRIRRRPLQRRVLRPPGHPRDDQRPAAHAKGLPGPLITKRDGCHAWHPEYFPPDDPRHGWTWADCWNDAVALLGSEEAVRNYLDNDHSPSNSHPRAPNPHDFGTNHRMRCKANYLDKRFESSRPMAGSTATRSTLPCESGMSYGISGSTSGFRGRARCRVLVVNPAQLQRSECL